MLLKYADKEDKGYLTFKDFSKIIRPNMANLDAKGANTGLVYT